MGHQKGQVAESHLCTWLAPSEDIMTFASVLTGFDRQESFLQLYA